MINFANFIHTILCSLLSFLNKWSHSCLRFGYFDDFSVFSLCVDIGSKLKTVFCCFVADEFQAIESVLKDKVFNDKLVQGWVDEICSTVTKDLVETNKPFKYLGAR